jgi:hydroxymethylpyrimidine pyrophosphatase-like HAD family hydrolase
MILAALATDYDGTIAHHGRVDQSTIDALTTLREGGRKLILVTGRILADLELVFPEYKMCDAVVAENGGLLFLPASSTEQVLGPPPPENYVAALRDAGVEPLSIGRCIVATWEPQQHTVLEIINALGLEWQIIFNKGAVMCLPSGINKASGLMAAASALGLSPANIVGVGDAENDHSFLMTAGFSAAVANAIDALKTEVDLVMAQDHGAGVRELINLVLHEPEKITSRSRRYNVPLGRTPGGASDDKTAVLRPSDTVLISGSSGVGKSRFTTLLLERMRELELQFCVIDPEGDYENFEGATVLGSADHAPQHQEAAALLSKPQDNVVLNLLGLDLKDRPGFFTRAAADIGVMRKEFGRPHWLVIDEAHHMLPVGTVLPPTDMRATIAVTVDPAALADDVLRMASIVVAVGPKADKVITHYCARLDIGVPALPPQPPGNNQVWFWNRAADSVGVLEVDAPKQEHHRHIRKYAQGELGEDKSFYFTGPKGDLNLRAQNIAIFIQIARGVDDATWTHHLRRRDYSTWFRDSVCDDETAAEIAAIEAEAGLDPEESRQKMFALLRRRYTVD